LVECFEAQGAGGVCTVTFKHNDGEDSAVNALLRVVGHDGRPRVTRGTCPESLQKALRKKQQEEAERKKYYTQQEYDEKSRIAEKLSLNEMKESLQNQTVKIEGVDCRVCKIDNAVEDMQTHVIKIDDVQSEVTKIGTYVSDRIPDIEKRLASETKQKFENMGRLGPLTRRNNLLEARNAELEKINKELVEEKAEYIKKEQAWIVEKSELLTIKTLISSLQRASDQLQHTSAMNASVLESNSAINEELQRTADVLASTLEEERAAKRARV